MSEGNIQLNYMDYSLLSEHRSTVDLAVWILATTSLAFVGEYLLDMEDLQILQQKYFFFPLICLCKLHVSLSGTVVF
jgi:hypothetical protein